MVDYRTRLQFAYSQIRHMIRVAKSDREISRREGRLIDAAAFAIRQKALEDALRFLEDDKKENHPAI